jgi:hypothetical protein
LGATLATPAGADGVTTDKAGHFSAKFPSTPVETQVPSTVGSVRFVLHLASVRTPDLVAVEEADFTPSLPASSFDTNLRSTLGGFAATSGLTLVSQSATTFQGHAARKGEFSGPAGEQYEMVAFMTDGGREYMLVGPTGTYDELAASFTILP